MADCVAAMVEAIEVPVTVKTRLGVDGIDGSIISRGSSPACGTPAAACVIVHAREALLNLRHARQPADPAAGSPPRPASQARLRALRVVLNGGIGTLEDGLAQLADLDGVMLGRAAYERPLLLAGVDARVYGDAPVPLPSPTAFLTLPALSRTRTRTRRARCA